MSRYIDAKITLKIIDNYAKTVTADGKVVVDAIRDIVGVIAPTADVVEVVRCRDCKEKYINAENGMRCRLSGRSIVEDDYCSKADKIVYCKDCKHIMFSDCYGECAEAHKGIVQPDDYCIYGERREE